MLCFDDQIPRQLYAYLYTTGPLKIKSRNFVKKNTVITIFFYLERRFLFKVHKRENFWAPILNFVLFTVSDAKILKVLSSEMDPAESRLIR